MRPTFSPLLGNPLSLWFEGPCISTDLSQACQGPKMHCTALRRLVMTMFNPCVRPNGHGRVICPLRPVNLFYLSDSTLYAITLLPMALPPPQAWAGLKPKIRYLYILSVLRLCLSGDTRQRFYSMFRQLQHGSVVIPPQWNILAYIGVINTAPLRSPVCPTSRARPTLG